MSELRDDLERTIHEVVMIGEETARELTEAVIRLLVDRGLDARVFSDLAEGSTQPTRDDVEMEISVAWGMLTDDAADAVLAREAVDVLVARGWLGVSDTPNEGDANE